MFHFLQFHHNFKILVSFHNSFSRLGSLPKLRHRLVSLKSPLQLPYQDRTISASAFLFFRNTFFFLLPFYLCLKNISPFLIINLFNANAANQNMKIPKLKPSDSCANSMYSKSFPFSLKFFISLIVVFY